MYHKDMLLMFSFLSTSMDPSLKIDTRIVCHKWVRRDGMIYRSDLFFWLQIANLQLCHDGPVSVNETC